MPFLDPSKATKLKDLMFRWRGSTVRWITMTLQSIQSKNLQQIAVHPYATTLGSPIEESVYWQWEDLDSPLIQFWTSSSIRPWVVCEVVGEEDMKDYAPSLLPELTRRGLVDLSY